MSNADDIIYKEALINAYIYGSAETKIVLQKIMVDHPELRSKAKELIPNVDRIVKKVNSLSEEEVAKIVEEKYNEDIIVERKERDYLPKVVNAKKGNVVVRYPPEPSKHPHIGQMLSFCINHLIAERYDGKTVLRYDDTNPERAKAEYYDGFREAINWMNLKLDEEVRASDYMEVFYEKAIGLIKNNDAYICTCSRETFSQLRAEEKPCECNLNHSTDKNLQMFEQMLNGEIAEGEAVVRFRGDMASKNTALRDPVLMRISEHPHAIHGDKYRVWPMYDFESTIMEDITKVTHILRSIEFGKMREELQKLIAKKLNLNCPEFLEYSRFNIIGAPTQGRVIRELVEQGIVTDWDDYRLVTYQALKRRGIQPETFIEIIKRVGATKSTTNIDWSLISSINRKIIEPKVKHVYFVDEPIKVKIKNPKIMDVEIPFHLDNQSLGKRKIHVSYTLYLSREDNDLIKENQIIRMKDLYNILITKEISSEEFEAEIHSEELLPDVPRVQWVSDPIKVEILKPEMLYLNNRINKDSLRHIHGLGEKALAELNISEIVQLERFGYAKVNEINEKIKMNYIHG
jgi:glutamyl-tRNA synthetase